MLEKICDNCDCQEGRHYCLLLSKFIKNMDLFSCDNFTEKDNEEDTKCVNQVKGV